MRDDGANDRAQAAVAADLLAHGVTAHCLSAALTFGAALTIPVLGLLRPDSLAMAMATLVVVLGAAELWVALRVSFDARIFERLAGGGAADGLDVGRFDAAMQTVGLLQADKVGRPVALRIRGAMGLLGRQLALLLAQLVVLAGGGWILAGTGS